MCLWRFYVRIYKWEGMGEWRNIHAHSYVTKFDIDVGILFIAIVRYIAQCVGIEWRFSSSFLVHSELDRE